MVRLMVRSSNVHAISGSIRLKDRSMCPIRLQGTLSKILNVKYLDTGQDKGYVMLVWRSVSDQQKTFNWAMRNKLPHKIFLHYR